MNDFEKQIEEQLEIYKMQLEDELKRLYYLMKSLGIDSESKLESTLEFAELFNKLKNEGVIRKLSDGTP